jgi:quaternary ammonium compound-resistance protein SugE
LAWLLLLLAAACEMILPIGFRYTNGFKTNYPLIALTMLLMIASFALLSQATNRGIHVGTAYAAWTGLGATGTAILGIIRFNEPRDLKRLSCLALVIIGVLGLKFFTPPETKPLTPAVTTTPLKH